MCFVVDYHGSGFLMLFFVCFSGFFDVCFVFFSGLLLFLIFLVVFEM